MDRTVDVAQLVIRTKRDEGYKYFLAKRTKDGYWEWIGGKKEDESIKEAAIRELKEEIKIDWEKHYFELEGIADSYPSKDSSKYHLNPVLIEVGQEAFEQISKADLSREHDKLAWIELTDFDEYDTLGQYKALERLDLIEGDVALAVVENQDKYLVVQRSEENTSSGRWTFVSGKIESDENPEEAAVREVREETRIEAEVIDSNGWYIGEGEQGHWRLFPELLKTETRQVDLNWELSDYEWLKINEIRQKDSLGKMKSIEKLGLEDR